MATWYQEADICKWLCEHIHVFNPHPDFMVVATERLIREGSVYSGTETGRWGIVDLYCALIPDQGIHTAYLVECKKKQINIASVKQVKRYMDLLSSKLNPHGVLVAPSITDNALKTIQGDPLLEYWQVGVGGCPSNG